jgi:CheY-like chemotaxis protein
VTPWLHVKADMLTPTVLLVEDNPGDEYLTVRALRKFVVPVNVDVTRDGAEALDYLFCRGAFADRPPDLPTIVLLDLNLPKVGGLRVLAELRADPRTQFLPVIILTSSDEQTDSISSYMHGANSYVRKPVKAREFDAVVRALGVFWLKGNLAPPHGDAMRAPIIAWRADLAG